MNPITIAAIAFVTLLVVLAVFQIALAAGAPLGRLAWGGQHRVLPTRNRIASRWSVAVYALIALVALDRSDLVDVVPGSWHESRCGSSSATSYWVSFRIC